MSRYTYDVTIEAATQEEATEKLKAATILKDPIKTAFAKKAMGL